MPTDLQLLKQCLENDNYAEAIKLYNSIEKSGYPKSILDFYAKRHPFLLKRAINETRIYSSTEERDVRQGLGSSTPLVSIIIVSYNSKDDLVECLESITEQSYTNWELILVDNGLDGSDEITRRQVPTAKIVKCNNVGFAEGNNVGLEQSEGELLLLLNPDAKLSKECLKELVFAGRQDPGVAAVVPKIYFYKQFSKLRLHSPDSGKFTIDYNYLVSQLHYQKVFIVHGSLKDGVLSSDSGGNIVLDLAINPDSSSFSLSLNCLQKSDLNQKIRVDFLGSSSAMQYIELSPSQENTFASIKVDQHVHSSSRYLINNAGSDFRDDGVPYDVGFGQEDNGQFNSKRYVNALCGCCALLRRDLFIKRKLFVSEFFAYFEDTELSHWIKRNKLKILYVNTLVFHKHSTATQESSPTWNALVARSSKIYEYIRDNSGGSKHKTDKRLNLTIDYSEISEHLKEKLQALDKSISQKNIEDLAFNTHKAIGIYNSYWSSMGGGEKHALDFAAKCKKLKNTTVYLISERDFSISKLSSYFDLDLKGCKKIICGEITASLTKKFDTFINSTYCSNLVSESANSYYIVSFPHKSIHRQLLEAYTFLHNSRFTASWALKYWGNHRSKIILPVQQFAAANNSLAPSAKEKICLTVGRFNYMGHCKNQHLIIKAFNQAINEMDDKTSWSLYVVGSMDDTSNSSIQHYKDCSRMAGFNVNVIPNISRKDLNDLYAKASIYIHATGVNIDVNESPQLCEHFGITVFESLMNGCYPLVHDSAGPRSQVVDLKYSSLYSDEDDLKFKLFDLLQSWEGKNYSDPSVSLMIKEHANSLLTQNESELLNVFADINS